MLKELAAFQRLERYPKVLGTDWESPCEEEEEEEENEPSKDSGELKLTLAFRGVMVGRDASTLGPLAGVLPSLAAGNCTILVCSWVFECSGDGSFAVAGSIFAVFVPCSIS